MRGGLLSCTREHAVNMQYQHFLERRKTLFWAHQEVEHTPIKPRSLVYYGEIGHYLTEKIFMRVQFAGRAAFLHSAAR